MKIIGGQITLDEPRHVKQPGSRGGHIIGHTSTGEPIYGILAPKITKTPEQKKIEQEARWNNILQSKSPQDRVVLVAARERKIVVPPAWTNLWISSDKSADLQVKGKDAKGRTQYLYTVNARNRNDAKKFNRLKSFSMDFPALTARIGQDLDSSEEAKVLYLISKTGFRVGGEGDTGAEKQAYGASTLLASHVSVEGHKVQFNFVGKKGVAQSHSIEDPKIVAMVRGKKGKLFDTNSGQVRTYLKSISGGKDYKVKDFRTYIATSIALVEAGKLVPPPPKTEKEKNNKIMQVAKVVAARLGNTPQMARDSYIDPAVFSRWSLAP